MGINHTVVGTGGRGSVVITSSVGSTVEIEVETLDPTKASLVLDIDKKLVSDGR